MIIIIRVENEGLLIVIKWQKQNIICRSFSEKEHCCYAADTNYKDPSKKEKKKGLKFFLIISVFTTEGMRFKNDGSVNELPYLIMTRSAEDLWTGSIVSETVKQRWM